MAVELVFALSSSKTVLFCRRLFRSERNFLTLSTLPSTGVSYQESVVSSNFCGLVEASRYSQISITFAHLSSCLSVSEEGKIDDIHIGHVLSRGIRTITDWVVIERFNYWYKVPGLDPVSKRVFNQVSEPHTCRSIIQMAYLFLFFSSIPTER